METLQSLTELNTISLNFREMNLTIIPNALNNINNMKEYIESYLWLQGCFTLGFNFETPENNLYRKTFNV